MDHNHLRLLFLGDSLIEFFDWRGRFPEHEVHNLGIAGETVNGLYARLNGIFSRIKDANHVFIMSGINNLAMGDDHFIEPYRSVIRAVAVSYPSAVIHVHTLLPVLFPYISNDTIAYLNSKLCSMAVNEGVDVIDLHTLFLDQRGKPIASYLLEDGVHISSEGYALWSHVLEKLLTQPKPPQA